MFWSQQYSWVFFDNYISTLYATKHSSFDRVRIGGSSNCAHNRCCSKSSLNETIYSTCGVSFIDDWITFRNLGLQEKYSLNQFSCLIYRRTRLRLFAWIIGRVYFLFEVRIRWVHNLIRWQFKVWKFHFKVFLFCCFF